MLVLTGGGMSRNQLEFAGLQFRTASRIHSSSQPGKREKEEGKKRLFWGKW